MKKLEIGDITLENPVVEEDGILFDKMTIKDKDDNIRFESGQEETVFLKK